MVAHCADCRLSRVVLCFDYPNSLVCHSVDSESGEFYYFNFATGETQWEHPLDEVYRQKVRLRCGEEGIIYFTTARLCMIVMTEE